MEPPISFPNQDPRLDFIGTYIVKSLKLKPEKWLRVLTIEEHQATLADFTDKPLPVLLVVVLTHSMQLQPVTTFPCYLKNKGAYFIKKKPDSIPKENCAEMLIFGKIDLIYFLNYDKGITHVPDKRFGLGKLCLDSSTLFQSDIGDATQRTELCINTIKQYQITFEYFKDNLNKYFVGRRSKPWTLDLNAVFERLNKFLNRLETILCFFYTVIEFQKLKQIEVGGIKGRMLGEQISEVSSEFDAYFREFASKSYDVLEPDDETFDNDYKSFEESIVDLDLKLATVLVESFDNSPTLDDIFKLIEIVGTILDRPLIKSQFSAKYVEIIVMLGKEITTCEELFKSQIERLEKYGIMEVDIFFPPIAGGILFMNMLAARVTKPVESFHNFPHSIKDTEEATKLFERHEKLIENISEFKKKYFDDWKSNVPDIIKCKANNFIIARQGSNLVSNFSPMILDILKEVHHLRRNPEFKNDLPKESLLLFEKQEMYWQYRIILGITINWYNEIRENRQQVEFDLVEDEIRAIDQRIYVAEHKLNWNSPDLLAHLQELHKLVESLYERMSKVQENLRKIKSILEEWSSQPLFERKNGKKDTLLNLDDRTDRVNHRYTKIKQSDERVRVLVKKNMFLFNMQDNQDSVAWKNYVFYIDNLMEVTLLKSIACSLAYMSEHMNPNNNISPMFIAQLELLEPNIVFCPSLEKSDEKGLMEIIKSIIADILMMSKLNERIDQNKDTTYEDNITNNEDVIEMKNEIINGIEKVIKDANEFCKTFDKYTYLWLDERDTVMDLFLTYGRILTPEEIDRIGSDDTDNPPPTPCPPKIKAFKEQIEHFESLFLEIEDMDSYKIFSCWLQVDMRPFRQALLNTVRKWGNMYKEHLVEKVISSLTDLSDFIRKADEGLMQPVLEGDYQALINVMGYLMNVKERDVRTDNMFKPLSETIDLLRFYHVDIPEEVTVLLQELPEQWQATKKLANTIKQQVAALQAAEVSGIKMNIATFDAQVTYYREVFKRYEFFRFECDDPYKSMSRVDFEIAYLEDDMQRIQESGSLFEVIVPEYKLLKQCRKELKMLKLLWDYVYIVRTSIEDWKTTPWRKIDVENMDLECKKFAKEIRQLDKEMRSWNAYLTLEATVKNMLTSIRAVGELQNPAIRERHWTQLMKSKKSLAALPPELTVRIVMDEDTPLADLLTLNLHECEEEVKNIVDKAVKEMSMEKYLKDLDRIWLRLEFTDDKHPRTGCTLLKASEELIETLEENQKSQVGNKNFQWPDHVIAVWFEVQRTWSNLESIFMNSDDIRKQLPDDSARFEGIDSTFKILAVQMTKNPNVVKSTNKKGLIEDLDALRNDLLLCEKALAEYLETKRLAFPRFYFISSADLLDILSNGDQADLVIRHLTKLFDSMAKLKFAYSENPKEKLALGMIAKDGEYVTFQGTCLCNGAVEIWLNSLQLIMRSTIRHNFGEAFKSYKVKPREEWLFDFMAQVSLCGTQIWWTTDVNLAFSKLESGSENALKDYYKKQLLQLSTLITLLVGELTKQDRQKIMTICTIDVHSRDVVSKLIIEKIETGSAFQWQSQLRHRWCETENHCFANICDAQFTYSYEYLGNTPRLVITPLTDRCYITLTQSLHLIMGGGPAGPAGTGKTETTKDLGRALGIMVYVFNCSEQMDYQSCGNIYKGLAQTGAWGCFDEFNRISVEVLSVVAVQVKSIHDAIRDKKKQFNFMGEIIALVPSVGVFVTMNPGYAGRTELPENLKALFRPCAMVVPDFELICEIMLVAEGFQEAKILARKFITLYTLCKEMLSKQDHYDWGLRAIKSVLVVAGTLKRGDPETPEEEVLMRTLRDFNIPKIVTDDVPVFIGLIADLFPALDVPRRRDLDFEKIVKQAAKDLLLQPEDNFILKVIQLEELLEVRHSVFVVGNAGSGKTQVWKTLFKSYQNTGKKPMFNDLNPKAVTNDELFGIINPATREWKDGLFAVIMRDQANLPGENPKWIILDGDIDPMWIESLNTVMDDNKILTLASNERIALTPSMRLMFEISNLRTATPATVSRAGILYINPQDLGWNPYVTSWIESRTVPSEKTNLITLFDKYVPSCLETIRVRFKKITPIVETAHIQMLCHLLNCLLVPENTPSDCPMEWYDIFFVFACVWAFGSTMFQDGAVDYRVEFTKWWIKEFKDIQFPPSGTVFDFYVDHVTKKFVPWTEKIPNFELDSEIPLQGFLFSTNECLITPSDIIRLWLHETQRVYCDKLNEDKDIEAFTKLQVDICKKNFDDMEEAVVFAKPNIYCHFAGGIGEPKYMAIESWDHLNKLLKEAMASYNDLVTAVNLVLFDDAMMHICRINRILESPRGSALLIGVGGSGKQSLSRLSAFISSLEVLQIQLKKGYGVTDLKMLKWLMSTFLLLINDLLASGEVADLFSDDEIENILAGVKNEAKGAGLPETREVCWKFFIDRVRKQLKVVLCFSPVGSTLRIRSRKFPALINCTSINWFHEWPQEALVSVAMSFLDDLHVLPIDLKNSIARFMAHVHTTVNVMSKAYLSTERRYNYTTPKSYLEQISLYSKLITNKTEDLQAKIIRLENGLDKLRITSAQVDELKVKLAIQEAELSVKNEAADRLIEMVGIETAKVKNEKNLADEEEEKIAVIAEEVAKKQKDCKEDLIKAEPALIAAQSALNTLNKANLTELKSFGSPVDAVANVTSAVMVLLAPKGKVPKDRSWKAAKVIMAKVDVFLDILINYDKENIHPDVIKAIQPYLRDVEFEPDFVSTKSSAAAGLCAWVINIIKFYEVYCDIEPKRRALQEANDELATAIDKLKSIKAKVASLEQLLVDLTAKFEKATLEKLKCQQEADATDAIIQLANRLINGLASENVRWAESVSNFGEQNKTLPGDILLVCAFISYVGCFTKQYRLDLLHKNWFTFLKILQPRIPITEGIDPLTMLTDDTTVALWQNEGLPSDRMSIENATILSNSDRWPLMIDPQLQGVKWIKQKYGDKLCVIRLGQKGYLETIEKAIIRGEIVLLENIGEAIDPVLDHVIGRNLIKKGKVIKIGDKEVEYNSNFRLILHTKLANPHYQPEMQAQTTLVNFTVTRGGLEDQLLAEVVKAERPDLEDLKSDLTRQQNQFKIQLKKLEDDLLLKLSSAGEDILADTALIENLETTKKTATDIEKKVAEAKITSVRIDQAREFYRPAAARASLLYFILNELNTINPIYQFSLKAFSVVFQNAITKAEPADEVTQRTINLTDSISYSVFQYTSRGLFECDKLIFATQMTFQVLLMSEEICSSDLEFFLRFPVKPHVVSPVDFLSHHSWGSICSLSGQEQFRDLDRDIETNPLKWKKMVETECPEREKFPPDWQNKIGLERLCMLRALRPDRMTYAIAAYIEEKMGAKYVENRTMEFSKSFEETSSTTPIFFILSPGVNPLQDVEALGKLMGYTADNRNFHNVSLGQGQEVVAEQAMDIAVREGHWVVLQNIHLVKKWLPILEKKMETFASSCHNEFRMFMSAEPAPTPDTHIIPQGILESSIKITNEPPTGMLANIHKALDNFNQETLDMCGKEAEFKGIIFALCYFHAVVAERRKFGPQGWNKIYPFNVGDLTISVFVLYNYLEANEVVPWEDLRYLFGEIMYGGHITDDWDRRLCNAYLEEFMQPELVDGELQLAPGFIAPANIDYVGYHQYIEEMLPAESPYLYGLHPNAEIGFLTTTSENLFRTIFEMQPRDADASGASTGTREEKVKQMVDELAEKLPREFNMVELMNKVEERTPYIIVAFQECERMNYLTGEMKRSLRELELGLKGELTITSDMEKLENALFLEQVPVIWSSRAYPSLLGLTAWFNDLLLRLEELKNWTTDFVLPPSVWLAGFFNPQSFLTAIMQSTARVYELPLDKMCLQCDVTKKMKEEFTILDCRSASKDGAFVHGLLMEGARWDVQAGVITESKMKDLFPAMPVINVRAIIQDKQDLRNLYECPVYKTRTRGPTYVWTFGLKTKDKPSRWTLAGVALLLQT
ncbi:hypothetical protein ACJJTC_012787 [Scirpophaga incertulas]